MTTDLDARIRRAVIEVVDTAPPPPAFDELSTPVPRNRPVRRIVTIAIAAATVVALAIGAAMFVRDERSARIEPAGSGRFRIPLDDIPQGVSARLIDRAAVFLVRDLGHVVAFLASQPTYEGGTVRWCPAEGMFASADRHEVWNRDGSVVWGLTRDLDRFPTEVRHKSVLVDVTRVVPDEDFFVNDIDAAPPPLFCVDPVESTTATASVLRIGSLPSLELDTPSSSARAGHVDIRYISYGGAHMLSFRRRRLHEVGLTVPGGPNRAVVNLRRGRYEVYCSIPGHRAAGERATIVVTPK